MGMKFTALKPSLLSISVAVSAAIAAGAAPRAHAAEEAKGEDLAEITVTGSRIVRKDLEANSPIITVDSAAFEARTGQNVESYLNDLPNYNPASSPVTTEDDIQPNAVNSVGIATISLRGFGPNRSLVLLDGKRPVPANALMVSDVNAIPSAMLERVEIISGGASAVYGADAIGGVTNFLLKKKFQGLEVNAQYGFTEAGDGEELTVSGVLGTNFADNRGNITVALEHYDRNVALERNRKFYTKSWTDPNQPSDDLFLYGSSGYNSGASQSDCVNPAIPCKATAPNQNLFNKPSVDAVRALFPNSPANTNQRAFSGNPNAQSTIQYRFGPQGQIWTGLVGNNLSKYESIYGANAYGLALAKLNTFDTSIATAGVPIQTLKYNDVEAYASAPQERYSFFTSGSYDLTDKIRFFSRVNFSQSKTSTLLYPTVPISGWEARTSFNPTTDSPLNPALDWTQGATVTAYLANPTAAMYVNPNFKPTGSAKDPDGAGPLLGVGHPVSPELAILLMSRPNPSGEWMTEVFGAQALGRRTTENTNTYWQAESGVDFDLPVKDWSGELYWSYGESSAYNLARGNLSLQRWRALVNQPDWGRGADLRPNQDYPGDPSRDATNVNFGTVPAHCTSGLYDTFFKGDVAPSADCLAMVEAQLQSRSRNSQEVIELNLQGGIVDLPWAGEVRGAVGYSFRNNASRFTPDILESNISFLDQVVGIYPSSYLDASMITRDIYGELLVPVLKDLPLLKKVELELGYRHSTYSHTSGTDTYKALANIQVNDALRFRGGFNRANRAPNLGELFLGLQETYVGPNGIFNDPCSLRSNASYGAGGAANDPTLTGTETNPPPLAAGQTLAGARSTYLICQAQMTSVGAANFYGGDQVFVPGGGFANAWRYTIGNPKLKSEKADTWSAGFVFVGAGLSDNAFLHGLTTSVDWWKVDIKDAIQPYSPDYAGYLCYGTTTVTTLAEATAYINGAGKFACDNVAREPVRGGGLAKLTAYDNQATIATSGIDVSLSWNAQFADMGLGIPGGIGISSQATFLDYFRTKASPLPLDVPIEWKGSLGPDLAGTNGGAYDYRVITNFSYKLDKLSVNLGWRYLPSVVTSAQAYEDAVIANNRRVAAGGAGTQLSFTPIETIKTKDYSQFNLSAIYQLNAMLTLRAGIDNLFDVQPSISGATTGVAAADTGSRCAAYAGLSCVNPAGPTLARTGTGTFARGYNDILGRRFFLGIKANF